MLEIKDLKINIVENDETVVKNLSLFVEAGKIHFLMGRNGSGKSSFLMALFGSKNYNVVAGSATLDGEDILGLEVEEKVYKGMFLSFQNPVAIAGLSVSNFLKHSVNSVLRGRGQEPMNAPTFFAKAREYADLLDIDYEWLKKDINVGFSGGEKKKLEMLEMLLLEPKVAFLDEPDSGVDVNAVQLIAKAVNFAKAKFGTAFVVITHYEKLLDSLAVDTVSIIKDGEIVAEGEKSLAIETLKKGFK